MRDMHHTEGLQIKITPEYDVELDEQIKLVALLATCFPGYPTGRTFYNQLPTARVTATLGDEIIGQAGIHHRIIRIADDQLCCIFGISDFCVDPAHRLQQAGSDMMDFIIQTAKSRGIDFLMLSSRADEFYQKQGFHIVENPSRWLMIQRLESMGVLKRQLKQGLLVKQVGDISWPDGEIDFMGHMF